MKKKTIAHTLIQRYSPEQSSVIYIYNVYNLIGIVPAITSIADPEK